ncbi:cinnamoyl-CoA reductase-like SNL6 [Tasmannia lanceolata]|uniref:cinnamoyl-CoA reductase-like SNL6 n=1 Tax=Tasmannia lanceolata TaxID=3420 RepID=UPI004062E267
MQSWRGEVVISRPTLLTPFTLQPFSCNLSTNETKLVCVTSANSYLSICIVEQLLARGYRVRLILQNPEDLEDLRGRGEWIKRVESVVIAKMGDLSSLCEAFRGCHAVFHTSSFIDPKGISGYSERMALMEAEGAENVIEACGQAACVKRCILTSSLLASIWQNNGVVARVVDENCWSDEQFCRDNKLWLALGKTMAEKVAWRKSDQMKVKLVTICPALLIFPKVTSADAAASIPYLKGWRIMLQRGVLATADVKKVADAHVRVYEAIDHGACGRYLCFDGVVRREDEVTELESGLRMHGVLTEGRNVIHQEEEEQVEGDCILSNAKLAKLMSFASPRLSCNCIVVCCCCPCLIIQILLLVLLEFPHKLMRKFKILILKKFSKRKKTREIKERKDVYNSDLVEIQIGGILSDACRGCTCPIEEAEKVWLELSERGELVFGSFWGRNGMDHEASYRISLERISSL